jgi:hypothetical protein
VAAAICLFALYHGKPPDRSEALHWAVTVSVWSAVALTVYSGAAYVRRAVALFQR